MLIDPEKMGIQADDDSEVVTKDKDVTPVENEQLVKGFLKWIDAANIAEDIDPEKLSEMGQTVSREFDIDERSRAAWLTKMKKAMELAMQVTTSKTYPWPNASNVIFPLITIASTQFAARAYPAIISDRNVVKGVIIGKDDGTPEFGPLGPKIDPMTQQIKWRTPPGEKARRSKAIGDHMSWQLLEEQTEWEPQTDKLLHILPIVGCIFRKSYFAPERGRNSSLLVTAENLVMNYWAKGLETAPRVTEVVELYPQEIKEREVAGLFIPFDYGPAMPQPGKNAEAGQDNDAPHTFLEQHRWEDLDHDGFREPYIVTVHKDTSRVVRIVARYDAEGIKFLPNGKVGKIDAVQYYTQYDFLPNPDGGVYGVGFGQLLGALNESINTTLNLLIDSGHLANTGGGFVGNKLSVSTGSMRFSPGEFKSINSTGPTIRENIVQLQFPGPSNVLFQLLGLLIESGKEIASIKDVLTGEQNQSNVPATTTLALIEQGLKVFTAIYKRVYRSLKMEFNKLYRLNSLYMDEYAQYSVGDEWRMISRDEYIQGSGVQPVSDPSMVSDMQIMSKMQFLLELKDDQRLNGVEIYKRAFAALKIDRADDLFNKGPMQPSPELMLMAHDLDIKAERFKAQQILDFARAVHALSRSVMETGDPQVQELQKRVEELSGVIGGTGASIAQGQMDANQQPPMAGARKAPDGNWYIPDPHRPGKYLKINTDHGGAAPQSSAPAPLDFHPEMVGARQAPDGKHYIPDRTRPGKFLHVR